jgi:hypothetical protein
MTEEAADGQRVLEDLQGLVARLAGRLPDVLVTQIRDWLGAEDVIGLAEVLVGSAIAKGASVTSADARLLASLPTAAEHSTGLPPELTVTDEVPAVVHRFEAGPPAIRTAGRFTDPADHATLSALYRDPHAVSVRRAVRTADGEPHRRVYLFEADPGVRVWRHVAAAQEMLRAGGEEAPQVEAFWTGDPLSPYQQAVLDASIVLWARPLLPRRGATMFGNALDPNRAKHVAEWHRWNEEVWNTLTGLHRLVQRLVPRLPAERLFALRRMLGLAELGRLAPALASAAAESGMPLTTRESALLRAVPGQIRASAVDLSALDRVPAAEDADALAASEARASAGHRFAAAPPGGWDAVIAAASDSAALVLASQPGVAEVWRAWSASEDGAEGKAGVPVFLVAVDPGLAAWDVAFDGHLALSTSGRTVVVESFWIGDVLLPYQASALEVADPLWIDVVEESPFAGGVRAATVHDLVDAGGQPRFAADHPRLPDPAECDRLAARMQAGDIVVGTDALAVDAVDPGRGRIVPLSYRTDGQWIWRMASAYYLAEYQLAPEPGLLEHLRSMERGADLSEA